MHFKDMESAAEAAAESAKKAIAAAQAAAYLANKGTNQVNPSPGFNNNFNVSNTNYGLRSYSLNSSCPLRPSDAPINSQNNMGNGGFLGKVQESQSFGISHYLSTEERKPDNGDYSQANIRRHTYGAPPAHSDIKFDESDCDEEIETEDGHPGSCPPPQRHPPPVPSVHPKLPDYDALAARFEALKYRKP